MVSPGPDGRHSNEETWPTDVGDATLFDTLRAFSYPAGEAKHCYCNGKQALRSVNKEKGGVLVGLSGVVDLELPEAAYTTGKSPSHARVENLHDCYRGVGRGDVLALLSAGGMLRERVNGSKVQRMIPTQEAVDAGLVFRCSGTALWGVDAVAAWARRSAGISLVRGWANQRVKQPGAGSDGFVSATDLGKLFNVGGSTIGKWLDALGVRENGLPTKKAVKTGLARVAEMNSVGDSGKKVARRFGLWALVPVQEMLMQAGHPLDFDWKAAQKGKGRNGDVETVSVKNVLDAHVAAVRTAVSAGDGAALAQAVDAVPERFRRPVEARLSVPGFITEGRWRAACASMRGR